MGWTVWHFAVSVLSNGVTLFLYNDYAYQTEKEYNFWNVIAEHNITYVLLVPSILEKFEKENIVPSDKYDLKNFRMVTVGGSPPKIKHVEFLLNKVAKHIFVGNLYGSTELLGYVTGLNYNLPSYAPEAQVPSLGVDARSVDSNGKALVGERGELIIATPAPSFLIGYWRDVENTHLIETHLTKHPGFWCQNDECWINPETKGIRVIGRCDDTLIQNGERFLPADIYFAIEDMDELDDYVCVPQKKNDGENRAVLFVKLKVGFTFTLELREKIEIKIKDELWCAMVPQVILAVSDIPYNLNGKKVESFVRKIVATNVIPEIANIRNPECVNEFCDIPEILSYNEEA